MRGIPVVVRHGAARSARCTGVAIGGALLVAGFLYGLVNALLRDERRTIIVTAVFLCLAFFVLPTRVHERYLLPVFALVPLLAVTSRAWLAGARRPRGRLLHQPPRVLTTPRCTARTTSRSLPLGEASRTARLHRAAAVVLVAGGFLFCAWRLWRGAAREPDGLAQVAAEVEGTVGLGAVPRSARAPRARAGGAASRGPGPGHAGGRATGPARHRDEPCEAPSALDWIVDRITARPLRRDRSAALAGEPTGSPRPARPAAGRDGASCVGGHASRLPPRGAVRHVLRRGLPRPDRDGVPPGLALRRARTTSTSTPTRTWPSTRWRWASRLFGEPPRHRPEPGSAAPCSGAAIEPRWAPSGRGARDGRPAVRRHGHGAGRVRPRRRAAQVATIVSTPPPSTIDPDAHRLYLANADGTRQPRSTRRRSTSCARTSGPVDIADDARRHRPGAARDGLPLDPQRIAVGDQASWRWVPVTRWPGARPRHRRAARRRRRSRAPWSRGGARAARSSSRARPRSRTSGDGRDGPRRGPRAGRRAHRGTPATRRRRRSCWTGWLDERRHRARIAGPHRRRHRCRVSASRTTDVRWSPCAPRPASRSSMPPRSTSLDQIDLDARRRGHGLGATAPDDANALRRLGRPSSAAS